MTCDGCGRGDGGRALVHDGGDTLAINYAGDFSGGTRIDGNLNVGGKITGRAFGSQETKSVGTVYQAASDGFVVFSV